MTDKEKEAEETIVIEVEESMIAESFSPVGSIENLAQVKIIQPGWGSSGYYSRELLKGVAESGGFEAKHMHFDHPRKSDKYERPERSLTTLAGVTKNAKYLESGPEGEGVYAEAVVFPQYKESISAMAPYIGVSIYGQGSAKKKTLNGKEGYVFESLNIGTIDYVTKPGAGGRVLETKKTGESMTTEKDTTVAQDNKSEESTETVKENEEQVATNEGSTERVSEVKLAEVLMAKLEALETKIQETEQKHEEYKLRNTIEGVVGRIASETELPAAVSERIIDTMIRDERTVKEGADLNLLANEAIDHEANYIRSIFGKPIKETKSATEGEEKEETVETSLAESFQALGLDEEAAKRAANRRKEWS